MFEQALAGPHAEEFDKAMKEEIKQLEDHNTWTVIPRSSVPNGANILPGTWVFRIKRYPDGRMRKFKARFCVRSDKQIKGVDYFDKYSPVVSWSTVRMLLSLTVSQNLATRQVDFSNAFVQATLKENVYVHCPRGFAPEGENGGVLKLNKSLYDLVQAPLYWHLHLEQALLKRGFKPSNVDPCLYIKDGILVLTYVDDCLFFAKDSAKIDSLIADLAKELKLTV